MIGRARVVIAAGGRVEHLHSGPPLTIRQVRSDDRAEGAVCVVGSAAGPLAGDDLDLEVDVGPGARARLTHAGAALAQGNGSGPPARMSTRVALAAGARLLADPPPLVACLGSQVNVAVEIDLAADSQAVWRETVVLGRHGEPPGAVVLDWAVMRDGTPVLRQHIDLRAAPLWSGMTRESRVLSTELRVGFRAATVVRSDRAVAQRLAADVSLLTVLAQEAAIADAEMVALRAAVDTVSEQQSAGYQERLRSVL